MAATTITVAGITAHVLADGYRKGTDYNGRGPWRNICYKVAWGDSDEFMDRLVAHDTVTVGGVGHPIPHRYPGNSNLYCLSAEMIQGLGPPRPDPNTDPLLDRLVAYDWACIECLYGRLPYVLDGADDPTGGNNFGTSMFRASSIDYGVRTYDFPGNALEYVDSSGDPVGDVDPDSSHTFGIRQVIYGYSWKNFPNIPHSTIQLLSNCVNAAPFFGCPRGTLLCNGGRSHSGYGPGGVLDQDIDFSFTYQPIDHNAIPTEDGWVAVRQKATGQFNHPYADFSILA